MGINAEANNSADAPRIESRGESGFRVDTQRRPLVGSIPSNLLTRFKINANENADTLRARTNSVTHFAVKADEHAGVGTSVPAARLNFRSRQNEDPPRVSRQGTSEPNGWLSVSRKGEMRAGIFQLQNSVNTLTDGNGKTIFVNTLNTKSSVSRISGSGPTENSDPGNANLPNDNLDTGAPRPSHELVVPEDISVFRIRGQF